MNLKSTTILAGLAFALLAGCQKNPEPKTGEGDPTPGSTPAVSAAPPGGSVALPADQLPAQDATIPPAAATTGNSGDAATPTQANPTELQKQQEQAGMPHSGQVNNHSVAETVGTVK